jgi:hypothetical protein
MKRRDFLQGVGAAAGYITVPRLLRGDAPMPVTLRVEASRVLRAIPTNFTGLSYESAQLAHPEFFTAQNSQLIALVRQLSPSGVLRIGGNTSEYTHWSPTTSEGVQAGFAEPPSAGKNTADSYTLTPAAVTNLRAFLDATNWQLIYGLNLHHGTPETAAEEADFVARTIGPRLLALQFGNEPDWFHDDDPQHTRWTYGHYFDRWQQFYKAVHARVPQAPIAGPDIATEMDWVRKFAEQTRGEIVLLTGHYYVGGPPQNPKMTLQALMQPPQHLADEIAVVTEAARIAGVPYRMAEGNSCFIGGKRGVSDVFASALWAADYMLQLAQAGYAGVNLHGGGEGIYTPIATDKEGNSSARPIFSGMLLAQQFAGAKLLATSLNSGGANVTAYAAKQNGELLLAVFNKSDHPVAIRAEGLDGWKAAAGKSHASSRIFTLSAPALDSKQGVSFAQTAATADSPWQMFGKGRSLNVAPYSGVLVKFA